MYSSDKNLDDKNLSRSRTRLAVCSGEARDAVARGVVDEVEALSTCVAVVHFTVVTLCRNV